MSESLKRYVFAISEEMLALKKQEPWKLDPDEWGLFTPEQQKQYVDAFAVTLSVAMMKREIRSRQSA